MSLPWLVGFRFEVAIPLRLAAQQYLGCKLSVSSECFLGFPQQRPHPRSGDSGVLQSLQVGPWAFWLALKGPKA